MASDKDSANYPVYNRISLGGFKYCFMRVVPQNRVQVYDHSNDLICGTLEHSANDVSPGLRLYGFEVWLQPTPEELVKLIPLCGFEQSGQYFSLIGDGEITYFTAQLDVRHEDDSQHWVETYQNCVINRAVFSCQTGGPLLLNLQIIAKTMVLTEDYAGTEVSPNTRPWMMSYATGVLNEIEIAFRQFTYAVDWKVQRAINNSEIAGDLDKTDCQQYVALGMPFNSVLSPLLEEALGPDRADGYPGQVVFSRTLDQAQTTGFYFSNLKRPEANTPSWLGKAVELRDSATYRVYADPAPSTTIVVANGAVSTTSTTTSSA